MAKQAAVGYIAATPVRPAGPQHLRLAVPSGHGRSHEPQVNFF